MKSCDRSLIVFARAPRAGQVKTRLAAGIGDPAALSAYVAMAELVVGAVGDSASYSTTVAFTPASSEHLMREWLGASTDLVPQSDGDLGARMGAAIGEALRAGARAVVVIGTDCPDISALAVEDAFARLADEDVDVVLGPACDGGYYLIGMSHLHMPLFEDVPWSSRDTLRVTLERARTLGLSVALLEERRDVDTVDDWRDWLARQGQRESPGS